MTPLASQYDALGVTICCPGRHNMAPLASQYVAQLVEVVRGYAGSWEKLLPETTESLPLEHVAQILATLGKNFRAPEQYERLTPRRNVLIRDRGTPGSEFTL